MRYLLIRFKDGTGMKRWGKRRAKGQVCGEAVVEPVLGSGVVPVAPMDEVPASDQVRAMKEPGYVIPEDPGTNDVSAMDESGICWDPTNSWDLWESYDHTITDEVIGGEFDYEGESGNLLSGCYSGDM